MKTNKTILTSVLASDVKVGDVLGLPNYPEALTVQNVRQLAKHTLITFLRPGRNGVTVCYLSADTVYLDTVTESL